MSLPSIPHHYELLGATVEALIELGGSAPIKKIDNTVIVQQGFTSEQIAAMHPKSNQSELEYRLAWSRTILRQIGAVTNPSRGIWAVTEYGRQASEAQLVDAHHAYTQASAHTSKTYPTTEVDNVATNNREDQPPTAHEAPSELASAGLPSVNPDPMHHSASLERLVELAFIAELTQESWFGRGQIVDVLHSTVDAFGHDVVLESGNVLRHVQLKSRTLSGHNTRYNINTSLCERPSGCIVWIGWEKQESANRLHLSYRWFGGAPGKPLPNLGDTIGKHSKGNAQGTKLERPAIRVLNLGQFERLDSLSQLVDRLFGPQ